MVCSWLNRLFIAGSFSQLGIIRGVAYLSCILFASPNSGLFRKYSEKSLFLWNFSGVLISHAGFDAQNITKSPYEKLHRGFAMEAEAGIEPAYTDLQSAARSEEHTSELQSRPQ